MLGATAVSAVFMPVVSRTAETAVAHTTIATYMKVTPADGGDAGCHGRLGRVYAGGFTHGRHGRGTHDHRDLYEGNSGGRWRCWVPRPSRPCLCRWFHARPTRPWHTRPSRLI